MPQVSGNSSVALQFSSHVLWWFPWKFITIDFSDCLVDSSASLSALSNIGSFMSSLIWRSSNILALSFSMLIHGNFSCRKANPLPSLSIACTKSFITPNLMCKGGSSILFSSMRGWDWMWCKIGFNPSLNSQSCLTQCWSSAQLSQRYRKPGYAVYPPWGVLVV